jgi:hypothetical protein
LIGLIELQKRQRRANARKFLNIVDAVDGPTFAVREIAKFLSAFQLQIRFFLLSGAGQQFIEDVIVSLVARLLNDSRFLQQIRIDVRTANAIQTIKGNFDPFALQTRDK